MQREQAMQCFVKSSIDPAPGGHTGEVLASLTVDSFFGTGILFSCPLANCEIPNSINKDPATNFRLLSSVFCSALFELSRLYDSAFSGQVVIQLKQFTQRLTSISWSRKSMHEDLHDIEHLPQRVHLLSLNLILNNETFEMRPSNVPTGQIILQ
jgi:hypothetical protein